MRCNCETDDSCECPNEAHFRIVFMDGLFLDVCWEHFPTDMEGIDMVYEKKRPKEVK